MPFGLLTGLGAALSWGTMDVASALASRRVGSLLVTAGVVVVSAVLLLLLTLVTGTALPTDPPTLATAALLGLIGAGAYFAYFTGLRVGPIAVVSGMVAAYGGLTVVLSVVLRGETLTAIQAFGAAIATAGVILTGVAFDGGLRATRFAGPGVIFAIVALVLFSMMAITTDIALESAGWLQVLLASRTVTAVVCVLVVVVVAWSGGRSTMAVTGLDPAVPPAPDSTIHRGRIVALILVAGLLDVLGLASFAIGLESAPTWLVGLASSFGPAVTILVAVAFLGERLKPIQWFGLAGVAVGMVAIALP
jgi:drug/metabolite transporter (DMT)-like permease